MNSGRGDWDQKFNLLHLGGSTDDRCMRPTAHCKDERIGECHRQQRFSRAFGRGKCGQLARFMAEPLCPKNIDERIDVHLEEVCRGIPSASALLHCFHPHLGCRYWNHVLSDLQMLYS